METKTYDKDAQHRRRRLTATVKHSLRELRIQLAVLNLQVGAQLDMRDVDLDCLDLLARHGPVSPSALARRAGVHPATMTGILDRLERGGWITRERDPADRRAVRVRALPNRTAEMMRQYSGMNSSMDHICDGYGEAELELVADFLQRTSEAGRSAAEHLAGART
jgi:DNA-binding MarR family transcriptional regulator